METEWDPAKHLANLAKHGLDFEDVPFLDWDNAKVLPDNRQTYPEPRFRAFAMWNGRLHMVAFCIRGTKVRIISFRKANKKEVTRYGS